MLNAQQDVRAAGQERWLHSCRRQRRSAGKGSRSSRRTLRSSFWRAIAHSSSNAVRYSFLDYSTPERRRDACLAELSINRRFAPDLYLEVQPVARRPDGLLGFGNGASVPVDWLVVMRRFDAAAQLDRMAERASYGPSSPVRSPRDRRPACARGGAI